VYIITLTPGNALIHSCHVYEGAKRPHFGRFKTQLAANAPMYTLSA
jgi:hypothetical protein